MSETLDVLITVHLFPDLAQEDFDTFVQLAEDGTVTTRGVGWLTSASTLWLGPPGCSACAASTSAVNVFL